MPMTRPPYPSGFREQMVELVRSGRSPEELAREFEPSAQSIRNWVGQADRDEGRRHDGLTSGEREELRRLRRENRQLRQEREILAKAADWFTQAAGSIPSGSSSSWEPTRPCIPSPRCAGCWGSPPAGTTRGRAGHRRPVPRAMGHCSIASAISITSREEPMAHPASMPSSSLEATLWAEADRQIDAPCRLEGHQSARGDADDGTGCACPGGAGSGRARLHRRRTRLAVGRRHHLGACAVEKLTTIYSCIRSFLTTTYGVRRCPKAFCDASS